MSLYKEIGSEKNYLNIDCLEGMKRLPDNCIDSVITDPPYGLNFMGKKWDYDVPKVEIWEEVIRVLKPGGHLLCFSGTRTQHRMACNIEDAGFEIRDMIAWVYGSGFPKSLDVSKAIDKSKGAEREVIGKGSSGSMLNISRTNTRPWHDNNKNDDGCIEYNITTPATPEAKQWEGWGTALKPAMEPITVARKPFNGTVAENVLLYGTGGINIDDCRIPLQDSGEDKRLGGKGDWSSEKMAKNVYEGGYKGKRVGSSELGRFPANLIHDGSDEVLELFPNTKSGENCTRTKVGSFLEHGSLGKVGDVQVTYGDEGSAARFFYCAKASKSERNCGLKGLEPRKKIYNGQSEKSSKDMKDVEKRFTTQPTPNNHPTVKPIKLMEYLVKLVTPEKGVVLDPFMGSGSTWVACVNLKRDFIGFELDDYYCFVSEKRALHALKERKKIKKSKKLKEFW